MSALSIRNMDYVTSILEQAQASRDVKAYASLSEEIRMDRSHYWFIERKAKRGGKWIFVRDFTGTKRETAEFWRKHFMGRAGFRLRHQLVY